MKPSPTAQEVVEAAAASAFGRPLVQNNFRALLVEAMINAVLPEGWTWASADWAGWDFRRANGPAGGQAVIRAADLGIKATDPRLVRYSCPHWLLRRQ